MNSERFAVQRFCFLLLILYFGLSSSIDTNNTKVAKFSVRKHNVTFFFFFSLFLYFILNMCLRVFLQLKLLFFGIKYVFFSLQNTQSIVIYSLDSFCFFGLVWSFFRLPLLFHRRDEECSWHTRKTMKKTTSKNAQQSWSIIISLTGLSFAGWYAKISTRVCAYCVYMRACIHVCAQVRAPLLSHSQFVTIVTITV